MKNGIFGIKEPLTKGYVDRARKRAMRRKSPWNLILIPLVLFGAFVCIVGQFSLLWQMHVWAFPQDIGRWREFFRNDQHGSTLSAFLMWIPPFVASFPLGMLVGNCIAWCIPPIRRIFEQEAKGIKHASFSEAMFDIGKIALVMFVVCFVLGSIGALTLGSLK